MAISFDLRTSQKSFTYQNLQDLIREIASVLSTRPAPGAEKRVGGGGIWSTHPNGVFVCEITRLPFILMYVKVRLLFLLTFGGK